MQRSRLVAAALLLVVGFACCTEAKTPIFIIPGIGTSNLVGRKTDARFISQCPLLSGGSLIPGLPQTPVSVWTPGAMLAAPACWRYMMQLKFDQASGRFSDQDGISVTAVTGGTSGMDPITYPLFTAAGYNSLALHIETSLGYTRGVDLIAVPYDFRQDLTAMNATGELQRIADVISSGVEKNAGAKAVLIGHSMGGLVATALLSAPEFAEWRSEYIKGFLALAAPFGGAVPAVSARISGQLLGMPWLTQQLLGLSVDEAVYGSTWGQPSVVMLLPYSSALPSSMVLVSTPSRSYTVAQLQELLADIGDQAAADMFPQVHSLERLLAAPLAVPTACVYGRRVATPLRWRFSENLKPKQRARPGRREASGMGDGVVNIQSLQLCRNLISGPASAWVSELADASVDHVSVVSGAAGHKAVSAMLAKLL
ncbi:hypothetical protein OEZ85_002332 [Tetradesmus obliquus]|uniref:AB hydrolase-1 domain-containing protein n=1 Tax=Tetradesmus obliquus TaxID=3088 RepID=A0ABY8U2N3_TETOB|nr:hypothetical protein OEZ85_002332 [Tetradesmus obliquus]